MIFLFIVSPKGVTPRCTMGFFSSVLNLLLIRCAVRIFLYVPGWRCGGYPFDWFSLLFGVWFSGLFGSVTDLPWIYGSLYFQATDSLSFSFVLFMAELSPGSKRWYFRLCHLTPQWNPWIEERGEEMHGFVVYLMCCSEISLFCSLKYWLCDCTQRLVVTKKKNVRKNFFLNHESRFTKAKLDTL
jgi:hypothetical protein